MNAHLVPPGGSLFGKRRTPVVLQTEAAECGLACLAMVAGHYRHRSDLLSLRKHYDVSLKGMTLHDIVRLAHKLKLSTRAVKAEMEDLGRLRLPCILHWSHNHFVVLVRVAKRGATIHDPAFGHRNLAFEEISRHFTGIAMEVWPSPGFERKTECVPDPDFRSRSQHRRLFAGCQPDLPDVAVSRDPRHCDTDRVSDRARRGYCPERPGSAAYRRYSASASSSPSEPWSISCAPGRSWPRAPR